MSAILRVSGAAGQFTSWPARRAWDILARLSAVQSGFVRRVAMAHCWIKERLDAFAYCFCGMAARLHGCLGGSRATIDGNDSTIWAEVEHCAAGVLGD